MFDPVTASIAVSLVSPFLVKAGEKFAEKVGEELAGKTVQIYQTVREHFTSDKYAGLTLLRLEESPENAERQVALESVLREQMESDEAFALQLMKLVNEAKEVDSRGIIASGERSVAIGGSVNNTNINTGDIRREN